MAYTHDGYVLYSMDIKWGPHKVDKTIYFFAKNTPKSGTPCDAIPEGWMVKINSRTGLPVLGRINKVPRKKRDRKGRKRRKK